MICCAWRLVPTNRILPPLTTVRQNREQMAQAAFRRLLERIADPSLPPCDLFLPAPLVVRSSTERGRFCAEAQRFFTWN